MTFVDRLLKRVRQPDYTGENRCWACTVANTGIAVVASVALWALLAFPADLAAWSVPAAAALFVVSIGSIWLRGYLVPGTPTLTKRYFPDRVLRWFDKAPEPQRSAADIDVERELLDAGVLEECENVDDLCLDETFADAWRARIETVRDDEVSPELLRDFFPVDVSDLEFDVREDAVMARMDGTLVAQWESDAALIADASAADVFHDRYEEWDTYTFDAQFELVGGLRLFLERCPTCDGPIAFGEEVVESCCREIEVVAMRCEDCGARLFEAELTEEMLEGGAETAAAE
ncbi:MAG: hypothetical protein V5A33_01505 [Halobacteriales archaeon]